MRRTLTVLLAFVLLLTLASFGQVTKGSISGTVVDNSGAVVPDASIKATETRTGVVLTTTSDKTGNFRFNLIPPGIYNVEITKSGFATTARNGVQVATGANSGLGSVALAVSGSNQTVEVSASTPLLETTQTQVTNTFTNQSFEAVPGIQDNAGLDNMALLVPGVSSTRDNSFSNSNGASFSVNGLRGRNNDQQIDGQNNNDNSVGGPALFMSDAEFVGEYNIVTNNFGPEYGRNAGSVVNIVTKSGTNNVHGSIYGSENNSVLNSLDSFQSRFDKLKKPPRMNNEFAGFTLGNPIVKDKAFLFSGFDENIVTQQNVLSSGNLTPTPAGLATMQGCFPGSSSIAALAKYGPYGITAGNPTPTNTQVDADAALAAVCPGVEFGGVTRTLASPVHQFNWLEKLDLQGPKNTLSFRYLLQRSNYFNIDVGNGAAGYPSNVPDFNQQFRAGFTRNFTDRMVNELSVTFGRLNVEFGGNAYGNTIPNTSQVDQGLANVTTGSGHLGFGPPTNMPQGRIVNTWQVQDNWNYLLGSHALKAGVNWTYQRSPNVFLPNLNGQFSFTNWLRFAQNTPSKVAITLGNPSLDFREYDTFLYFGDEWKMSPSLTLNYGVTWTYYGQPANLFHDQDVKRESGPNPFWDPSLPLADRVQPALAAPKNSFGPSIGFAWSPQGGGWLTGNGKTVIRGGYRLSYDPPFYNIYLNMASSAPQVLSQSITGAAAAGIPLLADPTGPNVRAELAPYLVTGTQNPNNVAQTKIAPNFGPDKVHSWSFGIQRQLNKDSVFEARYVGNMGRDLFQSINANPYVADLAASYPNLMPAGVTPCTTPNVPSAMGRANCNEGITRERTNTGYSDYNGLQLELRSTRLWDQLYLRSSYTYSKTTDNVSEIFSTFGGATTSAFSQNPLDYTKGEHGISGLDIPSNFTLAFSEAIPFFKHQDGLVGHVLGGWTVAGSYIFASGQPYTPIQYYTGLFSGGLVPDYPFNATFIGVYDNLRPFYGNPNAPATSVGIYAADACNFAGDATCGLAPDAIVNYNAWNKDGTITTVDKNAVRYLINSGYSQSVFGTPFGNVPRNGVRDAKTNATNATIYKYTKINEKMKAEFHVTFNNVFNHRNFSSIDPFLEDAGYSDAWTGFGDPSVTPAAGRVITFGAAFRF